MTARFHSRNIAGLASAAVPGEHAAIADQPGTGGVAGEGGSRGIQYRSTAVQRLLAHAVTRGSDRDVVNAFVEALDPCEAMEIHGYVETVQGAFELRVTRAGAVRCAAPPRLRLDIPANDAAPVRLTVAAIDGLGFRGHSDVIVSRVGDRTAGPWLIVFSGDVPSSDEPRLNRYVALLDQALRTAVTLSAARLQRAILESLLAAGDRTEGAAETARVVLSASLGAAGAA